MKQVKIPLRHGKIQQLAYPWEVLTGYLPPHIFAHRLKHLNDVLKHSTSQFLNQKYYSSSINSSKFLFTTTTATKTALISKCSPFLLPILLTAFSLLMIFPYFIRNMQYLKKEWDVVGLENMKRRNDFTRVQDAVLAWVIGMLVVLLILSLFWIRGWSIWQKKKISAIINNQLAVYNRHDNTYGINWKFITEYNEDFVIIEQLKFATEIKSQRKLSTISEKSHLSMKPALRTATAPNNGGILSGGCTDEKRVTLVYQKFV
ncbi:1752_t:CDS:2 [Ambispora leptoticha]|uniref:1752_t:CDS:1 n=1 Tax=Ambispora leptoticha TaxID=144679 RepID=A0A9N8Z3B6_9GLOM|nr:1752_t:CDS:2 [Ambispora leptoticha]